jgi:hypothetical protein
MAHHSSPKERHRRQLERQHQGRRAKCKRILIVSEGSKTEPNYFNEIRVDKRLPAANIAVSPSDLGTEPIQVVKYAHQLFIEGDKNKGFEPRAFDEVYAVFDRDDHRTYFDALGLAASLENKLRNDDKQPVVFKAIASVPSFELWLLLHYEDILSPIHRDEVMHRLKGHIPSYEKGSGGAFAITRNQLDQAILRAERLAGRFTPYSEPEPFTSIVDLVKVLTSLP